MNPPDHRLRQLRQALDTGVIDQAIFDLASKALAAQVSGSGAIAQGDRSTALGAGALLIDGDNQAPVNLGVWIQNGPPQGASPQDLRSAYLTRLIQQADFLPHALTGVDKAPVRISSVYTALLTQRRAEGRRARRGEALPDAAPPLSAVAVLDAESRLVLMGGPGSGKSTLVGMLAASMAGELLGLPAPSLNGLLAPLPTSEAVEKDQPPSTQPWRHGALLPVHIVLRDLASQLPPVGSTVGAEVVCAYLRNRLGTLTDYAPHLMKELHERGGLVLFDGLDEVPDAEGNAAGRRSQIKAAVQDFAATFPKCRMLVTTRTYAYQHQAWKLDGFAEVGLLPFSTAQIHAFVDAWYAQMVAAERLTPSDAADRAAALKAQVERNERLRELTERPLLLTLIARLQTRGSGHLPERRETLYDEAVKMLLNEWEEMKVEVTETGERKRHPSLSEFLATGQEVIREQLNRLAFEAHRDQLKLTGTADIPAGDLVTALMRANRSPDLKVGRLVEYLRDRAGILAEHGVDMYQFPHRSFQEYLAACHLTDVEFPELLAAQVRKDPNRWREVLLLAAAKVARGTPASVWLLAEELCPEPVVQGQPAPEATQWSALLAGAVLAEAANLTEVAARDQGKLARIRDWQLAIMRRNTLPAVERALAGRTLDTLGDPRPEVLTLDGMLFCHVPPGPFVMGSDDGPKDERPQHTVDLPYDYFIGCFPVTRHQWQEFVGTTTTAPDHANSLIGRRNDPVTDVTWHDAQRFCKALTRAWADRLPPSWEVALPSEAEWEKAARGGLRIPYRPQVLLLDQVRVVLDAPAGGPLMAHDPAQRQYPWGATFDPEQANALMSIGQTSAVGAFPMGRSPYACEDMAGNVWEWTRSLWGASYRKSDFGYPYEVSDRGRELESAGDEMKRVVRGGAFDNGPNDARCAYRDWVGPHLRYVNLGFRVVLRSSPVL